jgi:protein TonB
MTVAFDYMDASHRRLSRWSSAAGLVATVHVAAFALAIFAWPKSPPREEPPGAIMMDLPALAAESASDQTDVSDRPEMTQSAPPPSPADAPDEAPAESALAAEAPPAEQKVAEAPPEPQQAEPLPPVEEAPLAPEPEVTLPKAVEPKPEQPKKAEEKTEKKKTDEKAAERKADPKPAQKSDSKQQQKAAASSAGKFDPNPIYRASPAYPAGARAGKVQGAVVVSYSVSPSGAVTNVRVVSASPPGVFNGATIAAVRQWRFKPSPQGGTRTTTVRFKLK